MYSNLRLLSLTEILDDTKKLKKNDRKNGDEHPNTLLRNHSFSG